MGEFKSGLDALYMPQQGEIGELLSLPTDELQHARALRLRVGDEVSLLDGRGTRTSARVETVDRRQMLLRVQSRVLDRANAGPYIALGVGILSDRGRFEWIVEKATELGAAEIIPLVTEHSEGRYHAERCNRVAIAALKQSQRSYLPLLGHPVSLRDLFSAGDLSERSAGFDHIYVCHEDVAFSADGSLTGALLRDRPTAGRILLLIGPEGGFSTNDIEQISSSVGSSIHLVSLGRTRLRAETAAVAALVLANSIVNLIHQQSNE